MRQLKKHYAINLCLMFLVRRFHSRVWCICARMCGVSGVCVQSCWACIVSYVICLWNAGPIGREDRVHLIWFLCNSHLRPVICRCDVVPLYVGCFSLNRLCNIACYRAPRIHLLRQLPDAPFNNITNNSNTSDCDCAISWYVVVLCIL